MYEVVAIYSKLEDRTDELIATCKEWNEADVIASCTSCNAHVHSVDVFWVSKYSSISNRSYLATYKSGYKM